MFVHACTENGEMWEHAEDREQKTYVQSGRNGYIRREQQVQERIDSPSIVSGRSVASLSASSADADGAAAGVTSLSPSAGVDSAAAVAGATAGCDVTGAAAEGFLSVTSVNVSSSIYDESL